MRVIRSWPALVVALALAGCAPPTSSALRIIEAPVVAFVGDSFTGGSGLGGYGEKGWPRIVSAGLGWSPVLFAVGGSGFVSGGQAHETYLQRVPRVVAAQPDAVVIEGGQNDLSQDHPVGEIAAGAEALLRLLRAELPAAMLVVISPLVPGEPSPAALDLRDAMREVSAAAGVTFIDPIAEQWLSGPRAVYIGGDGVHPTDEGHAAMARLAQPRLAAVGVPRRAMSPVPK